MVTVHPPKPGKVAFSSPASNSESEDTTPSFDWMNADYAESYHLQIATDSKFKSIVLDQTGIGVSNYTSGALTPGKYYWRVQAMNVLDQYGSWSSVWNHTIYPSFNTQFNTNGQFEGWGAQPGAGWSVNSGSLYTNGLADVYTSSASYNNAEFKDFTYTARVKMDEPAIGYVNVNGLVLRGTPSFNSLNDWENAYYVAIVQINAPENDFVAACPSAWKIVNGKWTSLQREWWCEDYYNYAGYNEITAYMKGTTLKFYINDYLVLSKSITGPVKGRLGVFQFSSSAKRMDVDWAMAGMPAVPTEDRMAVAGSLIRTIEASELEALLNKQ